MPQSTGVPVPGCEPRNFLRSCLLLLLQERADHGYDLVERLKDFGVAEGDPGSVYRTLRSIEQAGLVRSDWLPPQGGPARRIYHLTAAGEAALRSWVDAAVEARRVLDGYLTRYALVSNGHAQWTGCAVANRTAMPAR